MQDRAIRDVLYEPRKQDSPVEAFSLASLLSRAGAHALRRPERMDFHLVIICTAGAGIHEVDFAEVELRPLRVVHVRPTQVHRWRLDTDDYEATLVMFPDITHLSPPGWPSGPRWYDIAATDWSEAGEVLQLLDRESSSARTLERRKRALEAIRELLIVKLSLDVDRRDEVGTLPPAYVAFRNLIEHQSSWSRSVTALARELGYSPRTVTRSCKAATGHTAKELVDERVALEARRLLAHTDRTVASIADELSFSEATNFTKFFRRATGETPAPWRRRFYVPS